MTSDKILLPLRKRQRLKQGPSRSHVLDLYVLTDKTSWHHIKYAFLQPMPLVQSANIMIHLHRSKDGRESWIVHPLKNLLLDTQVSWSRKYNQPLICTNPSSSLVKLGCGHYAIRLVGYSSSSCVYLIQSNTIGLITNMDITPTYSLSNALTLWSVYWMPITANMAPHDNGFWLKASVITFALPG